MAITGTEARISNLTTNLEDLARNKGVYIDEKGELLGKAIRNSFKGGIVKTLIDKGIAKAGNFIGRVVIALVGKENFNLLSMSSKDAKKTSVTNVLKLLEQLETKGLDKDMASCVSGQIYNQFSVKTPIRKLSSGIHQLHKMIQEEFIPKRLSERQKLVDAVASGKPTENMEKATQTSLSLAIRGLEEKIEVTHSAHKRLGELAKLNNTQTSSGQGSVLTTANSIINEYEDAVLHAQVGLEDEINTVQSQLADAMQQGPLNPKTKELQGRLDGLKQELDTVGDTMRQQFIDSMKTFWHEIEVDDGMHVPLDGGNGHKVTRTNEEGQEVMGVSIGSAEMVDVESIAPKGWADDFKMDLNEALRNSDQAVKKETLMLLAGRLCEVTNSPLASDEDKQVAHQMIQDEAFLHDFDTMLAALGGSGDGKNSSSLKRHWENVDKETIKLYQGNAGRIKEVIDNKIHEMDKYVKEPESRPDYSDFEEVFEDSAWDEARADAKQVRNTAEDLLRRVPIF